MSLCFNWPNPKDQWRERVCTAKAKAEYDGMCRFEAIKIIFLIYGTNCKRNAQKETH